MKLRSLQIKGFKSFGNETTIHFNDEIIGIVGPNGSGKSNIVDAIRWVLGEQKSKELRLDKMVDVIFNGTKSKRKAGMAMVSMTFENSKKLIPVEFDTVKISRILYDTNESEYRINDVPCRLKDVRDLFLDTGIGSNSYAIIELGMVDDILVDKDHSRRRMFEQAAGIAKYKVRKHEAQLKLKNTQADLDRVEDILYELESSMKSLERQARRTRKYYELKEEYKELSIRKAIHSQAEAIQREKELKEALTRQQDALLEVNGKMHTLEAELESIKKSNLDSEQALSARQKEFNEIVDRVRTGENQKEIKRQNISFHKQNIEREKSSLRKSKETMTSLTAQLEEKKKQLKELEEEGAKLQAIYNQKKSEFQTVEAERKNIQGASAEQLSDLKNAEDRKFALEKRIIEIKSRSNHFEQNRQAAHEDIKRHREALAEIRTERTGLEQDLKRLNDDLKALRQQKESLESDKDKLNDQIEQRKNDLALRSRKLDAMTHEYNLLKDMVDKLEGFPESAKFLVRKWEKPKPLLSDIIECPDEYRTAIEAYLDHYLAYFILEDVAEARKSISLLKEAQKGRAQFFILSSFEDKVSNEQVLYDHHGLPALEVVKTDPRYSDLMHWLLQNVILVDDDEVLQADTLDEELIYLSRNGTTNRTRHAVSGGSVGLFDGKKIGRKKEIDKLKKAIQETREEIETSEKKIAGLKSQYTTLFDKDYDRLINETGRTRNQVELKLAELSAKEDSITSSIANLEEKIASYLKSDEEDAHQVVALGQELESIEKQVARKKEAIDSQAGQVEDITHAFTRINAEYNTAHLDWVQHQNALQTLHNEIAFREQQSEELSEKADQSTSEIERLEKEVNHNEKELDALEQKLIADYTLKKEKQAVLNETEQAFFANRSVISEKEDELRQANKSAQNIQLKINDLKDNLTGTEFELRSALERLKIEFNVDIKELSREDYITEPEEVEALQERYEKIKKRLENYGEINPLAVEAYDEIQERYTSMVSQRDDIIEARSSLEETIKEIDTDATDKFIASFEKVKENFKSVFRSLFSSEDDCDLVLFNPENPLDSDIEIVAKPKGKRPKVLNQLSGGEKTLTATALLFSLYLLKPAPFCIFDEVDAPLDDVNIRKFSRLIRQFSDASQFIIITHNKSTMAAMDLLYGVYMQEQGVSGITQVDFRDYEHDEIFQKVNVG